MESWNFSALPLFGFLKPQLESIMGELELRKATHQKTVRVPSERHMENESRNALYSCYSKCGPQVGRAGNAYAWASPTYWIKTCGQGTQVSATSWKHRHKQSSLQPATQQWSRWMMCFRRNVELKETLVIYKENLKGLHWGMLPKQAPGK